MIKILIFCLLSFKPEWSIVGQRVLPETHRTIISVLVQQDSQS